MFDRLLGNPNAKITLRRLLKGGRVPHSFLFAGDEGVGKRQFALELAKSLLCGEPVDGESCGVCPVCRRCDVFAFPRADDKDAHKKVIVSDYLDLGTVIPYNRNILVDAIRDLEKEANFLPSEGRARVFVVDDADKMNDSATNALLKTLEEPADTTYLFLISSRPDKLLPTIRSRCQTLRFAPVEIAEIESFLINDRAFSHDEAKLAARLSRGSIARAVGMDIAATTSLRDRALRVITSSIQTADRAALIKASEEMNDAKNKERFEESLDMLESLIHDVWKFSAGGNESHLTNADLAHEIQALAGRCDRVKLIAWLAAIETLRANLIVNINKRVSTDGLFVSMAA